jgi:hypothetical protein
VVISNKTSVLYGGIMDKGWLSFDDINDNSIKYYKISFHANIDICKNATCSDSFFSFYAKSIQEAKIEFEKRLKAAWNVIDDRYKNNSEYYNISELTVKDICIDKIEITDHYIYQEEEKIK